MSSDAATFVREARQHAGLSQVELAGRAGVAQSVISAYESGKRDPGFDMLTKLLSAAGASIVVEYEPTSHAPRSPSQTPRQLPDTPRGRKLRKHREEIFNVVADRGASNVRVFGSVARGNDGPDSDIDLMVDVPADFGLFDLGGLIHDASTILGEEVDVVPGRGIDEAFADNIKGDVVPL